MMILRLLEEVYLFYWDEEMEGYLDLRRGMNLALRY